jgi:preprotein translocase subunit SecG
MWTIIILVLGLFVYLCLVGLIMGDRNKCKDTEFGAGFMTGSMYNDNNNDRFF